MHKTASNEYSFSLARTFRQFLLTPETTKLLNENVANDTLNDLQQIEVFSNRTPLERLLLEDNHED